MESLPILSNDGHIERRLKINWKYFIIGATIICLLTTMVGFICYEIMKGKKSFLYKSTVRAPLIAALKL